jgi:two-component system osmolarity sensor histidine kinase EnvZ
MPVLTFLRPFTPARTIKRFLPRSLLGRSLLMILLPLVLLQIVALRIFYGTHLDLVSRRLSTAIAGEIAYTVDLLQRFPGPTNQAWILASAREQFDLTMRLEPGALLPRLRSVNVIGPFDDDLAAALEDKVGKPYYMDWDWDIDPRAVLVRVQLADGVLDIEAPRKRLYFATVYFYVVWLVGTSLIVFLIAAAFMRNQVRAIRRLSEAAEAFGMGRDRGPIRPEGATEVRKAATAFNRMRERVMRFLVQRTEMLAGVSHDLRTPLTRLRLALAVLPHQGAEDGEIAEMEADLAEMERMISGYLAFARGEGTEQAQPTDLAAVLDDIAGAARRGGATIDLTAPPSLVLPLRADAVRRAITNLVDNANRHGRRIALAALAVGRTVYVTVDDDGAGIPPDRRESVFRPFESGAVGGTGLGLTIARDIIRAHGGDISLEDSPLGGLRARIRLPV